MSHNNTAIQGLTPDEQLVLDKYRRAKSFGAARVYINLVNGQVTQLDVTEKETPGNLTKLRG